MRRFWTASEGIPLYPHNRLFVWRFLFRISTWLAVTQHHQLQQCYPRVLGGHEGRSLRAGEPIAGEFASREKCWAPGKKTWWKTCFLWMTIDDTMKHDEYVVSVCMYIYIYIYTCIHTSYFQISCVFSLSSPFVLRQAVGPLTRYREWLRWHSLADQWAVRGIKWKKQDVYIYSHMYIYVYAITHVYTHVYSWLQLHFCLSKKHTNQIMTRSGWQDPCRADALMPKGQHAVQGKGGAAFWHPDFVFLFFEGLVFLFNGTYIYIYIDMSWY